MKAIFLLLIIGLCLTGCAKKNKSTLPADEAQRYEFKGKIIEISDPEKKIAKIQHEEIKGFMSAMTMKFPIKDDANFAKLTVGESITATLVYNPADNRSWLENLVIVKSGEAAPVPAGSNAIPGASAAGH